MSTGDPGAQGYLVLGLGEASLGKSRQVGRDRRSRRTGLSAGGALLGKSRQAQASGLATGNSGAKRYLLLGLG